MAEVDPRWCGDSDYIPTDPAEIRDYLAYIDQLLFDDVQRMDEQSRSVWWEIHDALVAKELVDQQGTWWDQQCRLAAIDRDREADELDALLVATVTDEIVNRVIPERAARYDAARQLLAELRRESYIVDLRHGAVRVWPDPPAELAKLVDEYQSELGDCLDAVD